MVRRRTYVKVAGVWRYVYRAVDQHGLVIDAYVSPRRDITAARRYFTTALTAHCEPDEVVTDLAQALAHVIEELLPDASHNTERYANNPVECDHGRLKARLRPMRGLKTHRTASVVIRGHPFIQNPRRGHYELGVDARNRISETRQHSTNSGERCEPLHRRPGRTPRPPIEQCNSAC
jgi:transposase, IS6 family